MGHDLSKTWIRIGLFLASVGCAGWAHSRIPIPQPSEGEHGFVPNPAHVRALAAGFDAILADYQWLRAVQVVGGSTSVSPEQADHLGRLVDVVTTLNPHVDHPYRFAALWLSNDEAQVREGVRLLRRATQYHPDDWRNYFYLGFDQFFYLSEFDDAGQTLERAMRLPGSPAYLPRLVARMKAQSRDIDVAEVFLREMLRNTADPEDRARLQVALDEIQLEYKARMLDAARAAHRAKFGRDIESVEDLVRSPNPVLARLPSAEPDEIPVSLSRDSKWVIDAETDRIVTTYLGRRYEVHYSPVDRARVEDWRSARSGSGERGGNP